MIDLKKVKIFFSYKGNIDAYAKATINCQSEITTKEWMIIDSFVQDIFLIKKNKTSTIFVENLFKKMSEYCENKEVIDYILQKVK
ncbi:hypothetical protein [Chryseobacterium luquanense]|uniref:Uncharacterized protein n=1 Tax=Chryseobacterium luquanense TaxID=2983766 RepID=A0ABT3Y1G0_9FLAO|nr:hypothetical protein [Chryseobacterium luquanense]MCX8531931.1 hypothetical protein [Chryseobacterium luquanense]